MLHSNAFTKDCIPSKRSVARRSPHCSNWPPCRPSSFTTPSSTMPYAASKRWPSLPATFHERHTTRKLPRLVDHTRPTWRVLDLFLRGALLQLRLLHVLLSL